MNTSVEVRQGLSEADVIREVRWRFRICNYLFTAGFVWIGLGSLAMMAPSLWGGYEAWNIVSAFLEAIGISIFSAAFTLTLAIYRCPICDKYLSRFRPKKTHCPKCGARVKSE